MEKAFNLERKIESQIMGIRNPTTHNYKDGSVVTRSLPETSRLRPQPLEEIRENGFVIVVIENTINVISVVRRNYLYIL